MGIADAATTASGDLWWKVDLHCLTLQPCSRPRLADRLHMDGVIRFRERMECVYVADRAVLKLYLPRTRRRIGGRPGDRALVGSIGFVLRSELSEEGGRSWLPRPNSLSICDLMNFPSIIMNSALSDSGDIAPEFMAQINDGLSALPGTIAEIEHDLGSDFLSRTSLARVPIMARHLRAKL
jgi:hypothetical protein